MTAPAPDPGVYIPTAQMYAQLQTLAVTVERMDGKLDAISQQKDQIADHESRIRGLEERRLPHTTLGIVSAGLAAIATAVSVWQTTGR